MTVQDIVLAQLGQTAEVTIDPHSTGDLEQVYVKGDVDVNAIIGIVLEHAGDVVMAARHLGTQARPGVSPTPHEIADELRRQGHELRG